VEGASLGVEATGGARVSETRCDGYIGCEPYASIARPCFHAIMSPQGLVRLPKNIEWSASAPLAEISDVIEGVVKDACAIVWLDLVRS
jgi:hypothetical protein